MITYPYKVVLTKKRTAYIEDDEGIEYMKFMPHPDGDPWMNKEGVEITLDNLKIPRQKLWIIDAQGNHVLSLLIEMKI